MAHKYNLFQSSDPPPPPSKEKDVKKKKTFLLPFFFVPKPSPSTSLLFPGISWWIFFRGVGRGGGARLEGEGVADPGHNGQGSYSNSTPPPHPHPPKMCFLLESLASGRDRGGGVRFFFSSFSSGVGGGQGELVGTRNNNPD